jgi:hypothetical protein
MIHTYESLTGSHKTNEKKFETTFRVLNLYRMGVCEEQAHSHSIVADLQSLINKGLQARK